MIPRILHHIWLGLDPVKAPELRISFMKHNIRWSFMMWTKDNIHEADISGDIKQMCRDEKLSYVVRGDCLRYALLQSYGGIYSDMDVLCLKPLDPLLDTHGFSSLSYQEQYGNAVIGCVPGYPVMGEIAMATFEKIIADPAGCNQYPHLVCGVSFQTKLLSKCETIHPVHYFQPFSWMDLSGRNKEWPDSYTAHQWHGMDIDGWTHRRFS